LGVQKVGGLVLVAGHEVAVAVERHVNRRVPQVGRQTAGVTPAAMHIEAKGVPAFVKADGLEPRARPGA
jgi:hypothetical protein